MLEYHLHKFGFNRSMLYNGSDVIRDVEWVIFDEVHYINDSEVHIGPSCKAVQSLQQELCGKKCS